MSRGAPSTPAASQRTIQDGRPSGLGKVALAAFLLLLAQLGVPLALAEDNAVLGGIAGLNNGTVTGGDGTGSAKITLTPVQLALVKQARDLTGTVLADNADVSPGQEIYFVLYVDNSTDVVAEDVRLVDVLDETQFTYVEGTLEQTTVATGSDDATIWAGTWTALSDELGLPDDEASILDTAAPVGRERLTVGAETGQANVALDVPKDTLWALRFKVTVK